MGKAIINQVTVGVCARHHQRGQIVEHDRQINLIAEQGLTRNILPDGLGVFCQRIQRATQTVIVEFGRGHPEVVAQDRAGEPVHHAIQRAGFWDRIISPSAPLVQKLMAASDLPMDLRDRLQRLGQKAVHSVLRVKKVEEEG